MQKSNDNSQIRTDDPEGIRFLVLRINHSPMLPEMEFCSTFDYISLGLVFGKKSWLEGLGQTLTAWFDFKRVGRLHSCPNGYRVFGSELAQTS